MKKQIQVPALILAVFWLAACNQAPSDAAIRRAAADAMLHREELLRVQYRSAEREKQVVDDLQAQRYDALEADLNKAEADFERDAAFELAFYDVLHAIVDCDVISPQREVELEAWVAARRDSAWSHIMLGRFYNSAGCTARGDGWAQDVTDAQWTKMLSLHSRARPELFKAELIDPRHLPIYTSLLTLDMYDNDPGGVKQAYEAGRKLFPKSFKLPDGYMSAMAPRWFGSYDEMQQLADSLKAQTQQNPIFWIFQGAADADQADLIDRAGDHQSALAHYKSALRYGDVADWLTQAARVSLELQDWGSALQFYNRNEFYEIPLSTQIEAQDRQMHVYCRTHPGHCNSDPKSFPWFGEPAPSQGAPSP